MTYGVDSQGWVLVTLPGNQPTWDTHLALARLIAAHRLTFCIEYQPGDRERRTRYVEGDFTVEAFDKKGKMAIFKYPFPEAGMAPLIAAANDRI